MHEMWNIFTLITHNIVCRHFFKSGIIYFSTLCATSFIFFFRLELEMYQMIYSLKLGCICRDKDEGCCLQLLSFIRGTEYFTNWMNWVELPLFILSTIFACATISAICYNQCSYPYDWQWQIGVVVTRLTWIEFIVLSAQFRVIGVYALMFVQVLKTFTELALVALLLIIVFRFSFCTTPIL